MLMFSLLLHLEIHHSPRLLHLENANVPLLLHLENDQFFTFGASRPGQPLNKKEDKHIKIVTFMFKRLSLNSSELR